MLAASIDDIFAFYANSSATKFHTRNVSVRSSSIVHSTTFVKDKRRIQS